MKLAHFIVGPLEVNSCLLWDEASREAAVIDFGARKDEERMQLDRLIADEGLTLRLVLLTHTHFDHVYGLPHIYATYGIGPMCHPADERLYRLAPSMAEAIRLPVRPPITIREPLLDLTVIRSASVAAFIAPPAEAVSNKSPDFMLLAFIAPPELVLIWSMCFAVTVTVTLCHDLMSVICS